jgi:hypothetical protein
MDVVSQWVQILLIFLLSIVKYGFGLFTAVNSNLGWWKSILANLVGGAIGVWMFTYFGTIIKQWWNRRTGAKPIDKTSFWYQFQMILKDRFGLIGIAILSPIILTIPVGVVLALQLTNNRKKIFFYIYAGCIVWSAIFYAVGYFLDFHIIQWLDIKD